MEINKKEEKHQVISKELIPIILRHFPIPVRNVNFVAKGAQWEIKFDSGQAEPTSGKYLKVRDEHTGKDFEVFRGKKRSKSF